MVLRLIMIAYTAYLDENRALKLNPNNNDSLSLVAEGINYAGCEATVLGNDGYVYGISNGRIIKFNPKDNSVSYVENRFEDWYSWTGAVLAEDSNIYVANEYGQILMIETPRNDWKITGNRANTINANSWISPVLGADKCIYFPPFAHKQVLKFNPSTQSVSLIGEYYGISSWKWVGAILASDGFIYCIPFSADNILQIDCRSVNEQVLEIIENLKRNDKDFVKGVTEAKKRKRIS